MMQTRCKTLGGGTHLVAATVSSCCAGDLHFTIVAAVTVTQQRLACVNYTLIGSTSELNVDPRLFISTVRELLYSSAVSVLTVTA